MDRDVDGLRFVQTVPAVWTDGSLEVQVTEVDLVCNGHCGVLVYFELILISISLTLLVGMLTR